METLYRRELNHSYLVLKTDTQHSFTDYCTKMLLCNSIDGLLPCNLRTIDGESFLYYEITSHQSLYQIYENKKFKSQDLLLLFESAARTMEHMEDYLIDSCLILFHPQYIYMDAERKNYQFCCFPFSAPDQENSFLSLTEYILPKIDHEDSDAVVFGYGIYKDSTLEPPSPEMLRKSLNKKPMKQKEKIREPVPDHTETEIKHQQALDAFFLDEEEEETSPLWWLWGCLFTVAALSACAGLLLHYRLASLFQTILCLSVIFFFGGGALLFYFLKNKGKKASPPQENPVPEIHTPIDIQPVFPEPQSESDDCFTVLLRPESPSFPSLFIQEPDKERTVPLSKELLIIGKHPATADICISAPGVSRIHAQIRCNDSHYYLMDLNSKNGTQVNQQMLNPQEEYLLQDNDQLRFGEIKAEFRKN